MNHSQAYQLGYKFAKLGYSNTYIGEQEYAEAFYEGHDSVRRGLNGVC